MKKRTQQHIADEKERRKLAKQHRQELRDLLDKLVVSRIESVRTISDEEWSAAVQADEGRVESAA